MSIFGLGDSLKKPQAKKSGAKHSSKQNSEAQAVLKKMKAKKDAGDCAFC